MIFLSNILILGSGFQSSDSSSISILISIIKYFMRNKKIEKNQDCWLEEGSSACGFMMKYSI